MVHGGYTMIGQTKDKPIRRRGVPTAQVQRDALMKTKNKENSRKHKPPPKSKTPENKKGQEKKKL